MIHNLDPSKVCKRAFIKKATIVVYGKQSDIIFFSVYIIKDDKPIFKRFRPIIRRMKRNCQTALSKKRYERL